MNKLKSVLPKILFPIILIGFISTLFTPVHMIGVYIFYTAFVVLVIQAIFETYFPKKSVNKFEKVSFEQYKSCIGEKCNLTEEEVLEEYNLIRKPKRATTGSAGYDIFAPFDFKLAVGETIKIPTGLRVKLDENAVLLCFPRSGHGFKYRLQIDNTVGIIDSDYYNSENEGHIMLKITNDGKEGKTLEVKKGEGFAQGLIMNYGLTIDDDADGVRNGGFGSTTKK